MGSKLHAIEVLSSIPYFAGFEPATLEAVANAAVQQKYEAGEIVFMEGEPCLGLYIVQDGWLKAYKLSVTGREQVIRVIAPGEAFNEFGVLSEGNNLLTVQALESSVVWTIPRQAVLQLMMSNPQLSLRIGQNMARRAEYLLKLIDDLSLCTVEGRLARLLLKQSNQEVITRQRWATQAEIAAQLGTVPGVISRLLHSLADEGLIRIERHQIHILNRQGLEVKALRSD